MLKLKIVLVIVMLLLFSCPVSADNWFNATLGDQFEDAEEGMISLLYGVIALYLLVCFICVLYGWKAHNRSVFKDGIIGFGVFIAGVVLYGFAVEFFSYYVGKYW